MAKTFVLRDDFDEKITDDVETVLYGYKGKEYEIDLGTENRLQFEDQMAEYIGVSRPVTSTPTATARRPRPLTRGARSSDSDAGAIREWARAQGIEVSERGRISADLKEQWKAAGSPGVTAPASS